MTKLKSFALTIAVLSSVFLFGMVNNSDAQIEIIDMYTPSEIDSNGWLCPYAYIETDKPFDGVDWFIGDPNDDNLSWRSTTGGDGVNTRAWFYPDGSDCPGHIKGTKYRVAARPWYYDDDTNCWWDREFRDFRVFEAKSIDGIKDEVEDDWEKPNVTGVYGYVELSRHYHDGSGIVMEGSVYARNGTEEDCTVRSIFRHTRMDAGGFKKQDPEDGPNNELPPSEPLFAGQTYSDSANSSYLRFPVPMGGVIGDLDSYRLNAHVHLEVHGNGTTDVWHETDDAWTHTFTKEDNQ